MTTVIDRDDMGIILGPDSPEAIKRGGPGSGHHGHRGRPGKVGGSLPSKGAGIANLRFQLRPFGQEPTPVGSLKEAIEKGEGRFEFIDPDRKMWALVAWSRDEAEAGYSIDEIDIERELEIILDVHDHFLEVLTDPASAEAIAAMDRDGDQLLRMANQWMEGRDEFDIDNPFLRRQHAPTMNIILTNHEDRVGAGSSSVGTKAAKVFWQPLTLPVERQVIESGERGGFSFMVAPTYVLIHEMHHGFGSRTELDVFSTVIGADYLLNNRDLLTPRVERNLVQELAGRTNAGMRHASGEFKDFTLQDRAAMGWLYSRHSEYFDTVLDQRRRYWETGEHESEASRGWWERKPIDEQQKKLRQWAKKYGT